MEAASRNTSIVDRMVRAARLDDAVYEEVERDRGATMQAALIVIGTSILAGIGSGIALGAGRLFAVILAGLVGWVFYAWITYMVGIHVLAGPDTRADWGELARGLGFAVTPRVLLVLGVVPVLAGFIGVVVFLWVLVTTVVALRAALDFTTARAVGTAILGWMAQAAIFAFAYTLGA